MSDAPKPYPYLVVVQGRVYGFCTSADQAVACAREVRATKPDAAITIAETWGEVGLAGEVRR
jgi:hypothetical protein